jgi:CubicO group peptidase (beta-lactamase class C family)
MAIDADVIRQACHRQSLRPTAGIQNIAEYLATQVADESHREVIGPLLAGDRPSGVVLRRGELVATWGEHDRPDMCFSATKSFVGLMAGVAHDRGLLEVDALVRDTVGLPEFQGRDIRWVHLLQQTSQWDGVLWGKPASVDAQSNRESGPPGSVWSYNDVRVNLLCLALTALFGRSLPEVLAEAITRPVGTTPSWSWHGYDNSYLDGIPVVSGGAHWGGGLFMSARDLAVVGQLYLRQGQGLLSAEWIARSWTPCAVKPDYGYLWWLNDQRTIFPEAPATGRCARGNGGRHLLWVDPARDLVIASHWGDDVGQLLAEVSAAVG